MRILGTRRDGAQLVAVGAGIAVILKGDQKSKPLDEIKAQKLGPWAEASNELADRRFVQKQLDRARMSLNLSAPLAFEPPDKTLNLVGPGKHSAKWHRCWEQVQAQGHDESSAAAICTAQLGDESYDASIADEVPDALALTEKAEKLDIVTPITPSEPIGGDRVKKQKPMLAKPLYTVAAVRKPKVKIVKAIPTGA